MKKLICILLCLILAAAFLGCTHTSAAGYNRYREDFFNTFDTVITIMAYARSDDEFERIKEMAYNEFLELHRLFDIYHNYEGIRNIKTINDNAGIQCVKVDRRIVELLKLSKEWYQKTGGKVNIALGPVLHIWRQYREAGNDDPQTARVPPVEALQKAGKYTDINKLIIDDQASTVYLAEKNMLLDVGAVAKGYATELVAQKLEKSGYDSVLISAGGNIRAVGKPKDGVRQKWSVGIKNPDSPYGGSTDNENIADVAYVSDLSVVSSGSYERYYTVGGKTYSHLIDPETKMPAVYYKAVTVVTKDSGVADILSTALFLMPWDQSRQFAESQGIQALWVMPDNRLLYTFGMTQMLKYKRDKLP